MPRRPITEFVEYTIAIGLLHFRVNVVARVTKLSYFLGQKFHTVYRIAENNALVDLQLGKEGIEAVDLLALLDVGVELRNSPERELVHEIDTVWVRDMVLTERLDRDRKGRAEETDLVVFVAKTNDLLKDGLEFG